jgi:hypothetical protein
MVGSLMRCGPAMGNLKMDEAPGRLGGNARGRPEPTPGHARPQPFAQIEIS